MKIRLIAKDRQSEKLGGSRRTPKHISDISKFYDCKVEETYFFRNIGLSDLKIRPEAKDTVNRGMD